MAVRIWPWVAFGSALGGGLRFLVGDLSAWLWQLTFPWDTLFINLSGSLLIGFYATLTSVEGRLMTPIHIRQFVITGVLGGYTTFSIFSLESLSLIERSPWLGGMNLILTMIGSLLAVWLGYILAQRVNRLA